MNHGQYVITEKLVDLIHGNFQGFHPGYRDVHANGRYYAATFVATPEAKALTRAVHFQGAPIPVTVRHSVSASGNPLGAPTAPSMSVKFYLPDGTVTDIVMLTLPIFPVRTPEETAEFLEAIKPDVVNGFSDVKKLNEFGSTRPWVARALEAFFAVKPPLSIAQTAFHALHAFRFINADGAAQYGRYHWEPLAGIAHQTKEELLSRAPTYLYEELEGRLRLAPVEFNLVFQLAGSGDPVDDANAPWPDDRPRVVLGRLTVTLPTTVEEIGDPIMLHDPTRLTDGIEASDDPILAARRGIYELSVAYRTGGWKGHQPAFASASACPFLGAGKA